MGKTIRIYVDESLQQCLERVRKEVAFDMKKRYNLNQVTIPATLTSQIIASKISGQTFLNFKIRKTSLTSGVLELM